MTIRVEIETTIDCPIDEVFDRLININDYSQWLPQDGIFRSTNQLSEGQIGLGTTYIDQTTVGTFQGEIIAFERPTTVVFCHRLHWLGMAVMETRPGYELQAIDGSTKLHHTAEGRLFGLFKLMHPRAASIARKERNRTVNALKQSLEA